jgi:3-hydroxybutyryl-CoA dehydratase
MNQGDTAQRTWTVSDEIVRLFAEVSGDSNPVHLDDDFARQSIFGRRIAHGMLAGSFISAVLATDLPGPGTIYLAQSMRFLAPVFVGDQADVIVKVRSINTHRGTAELDTNVYVHGRLVVEGVATVRHDALKARHGTDERGE